MPVPGGVIIYTLSLRGDVTTQKQGQCLPWSIDQTGLRLEATEVINQFTAGIRINHIGSGAMSLGTTFAGPFHSTEVRYTPPSTMTFIAQTRNFGFEFSGWRVNGNFGYEMRADFVPQPPQAELVYPPPGVEEPQISWDKILRNPTVVSLVVGSVAIAVGTIVEDILTAGGGIADDVVSFTLAAKMLRMAQVAATGI